jgi:hypothetical protein
MLPKDIDERADYYRIRAVRQGRSHYLAARRSQRINNLFGVPVVIITSIVGTAIFSTISSTPKVWLQTTTGLLSLIAAVFASLQTFFKFSELSEKHKGAAANYYSVKRRLDLFLLSYAENPENKTALVEDFQKIVIEIDRIDAQSPNVPDALYDQAKKEQLADSEGR